MLRVNGYTILRKLSEKAVRASGDATAMLVSGKSRLDTELRRLRTEAGEENLVLAEALLGEGLSAIERVTMIRLGGELCQVLECALETAVLLRGRTVRVWALFDRVRVSAALTERLSELVTQSNTCNQRSLQGAMREFSETSGRLAMLGMHSFEDVLSAEESSAALLLSGALDRWHEALGAAYVSAVGLLAVKGR